MAETTWWGATKAKLWAFHQSFHDSEVILWGRIQVALGLVASVLVTVDLSAFFDSSKALAGYMFVNGLLTEYLRRNRTVVMSDNTLQPETTTALVSTASPDIVVKEKPSV